MVQGFRGSCRGAKTGCYSKRYVRITRAQVVCVSRSGRVFTTESLLQGSPPNFLKRNRRF